MSIEDAQAIHREGDALYQAHQYEAAATKFTELLLHPDFPSDGMRQVHWNIGMCYVRLNNRDLAVDHFQAGSWSESEYGPVLQEQAANEHQAMVDAARAVLKDADSLYMSGSYSQAADRYAELLLHPGLPSDGMDEVHWNLGMCFFQLGNDELGRQHMAAGNYPESAYAEAYERISAARGG